MTRRTRTLTALAAVAVLAAGAAAGWFYLWPRALLALAEGAAAAGRWDEADGWYTRLVEARPGRADDRAARGRLRLDAGRQGQGNLAAAADDFREVLRLRPDDDDARFHLAQGLLADAATAEARPHLLACRAARPDRLEPLLGLAACAAEERDWDEAEALLRRALDLARASAAALVRLGDLNLLRERFGEAVPLFRRAVRLDPRDRAARLKLAQALRNSGRPDEAAEEERVYNQLAAEAPTPR